MPAISWPMRDDENCSIKMNKPPKLFIADLTTKPGQFINICILTLKIYESCKEYDFFYCHQKAKEAI